MRKHILPLAVTLVCLALTTTAQESKADEEKNAVRRVVETYLYAEEGEARKRTLFPRARIISVNASGDKVTETPISKSAERHKGAKVKSRQKILSIDVTEGGSAVKVGTDFSTDTRKSPEHVHYLSLLKVGGEWKIVSVLMPQVRLVEPGLRE